MLHYDHRIKLEVPFDYLNLHKVPKDTTIASFSKLIWYGYDEQGPSVYRRNPKTGEVIRIDFLES
jgi:hypothetical protein